MEEQDFQRNKQCYNAGCSPCHSNRSLSEGHCLQLSALASELVVVVTDSRVLWGVAQIVANRCKELTDIIGPVLGDKLQLEEGKRTEVFAEQLRQCHILIKDHAKELTGCIKSYGEGQIFLNASMSTSRTSSPTMTLSILEGRVSKSSCLREAGWPSALPESSVQKIMTMRRMKKNKKHSPPGDHEYSGTGNVWVKMDRARMPGWLSGLA
ncbi:uncharacterized protein AAEQ78_020615 [Lycaon pictus]